MQPNYAKFQHPSKSNMKKLESYGTQYYADMIHGKTKKESLSAPLDCLVDVDDTLMSLGFKSVLVLSPNSSDYISESCYLCKKLKTLPDACKRYFEDQFQKANSKLKEEGFDINDLVSDYDYMGCAVLTGKFDDAGDSLLNILINGICGEGNFLDLEDQNGVSQEKFFNSGSIYSQFIEIIIKSFKTIKVGRVMTWLSCELGMKKSELLLSSKFNYFLCISKILDEDTGDIDSTRDTGEYQVTFVVVPDNITSKPLSRRKEVEELITKERV